MNIAFDEILRAEAQTRSGLFTATAQRLGTTPQNVEKDFWVCWTLDALFNGLGDGPRLLFKGGTSLSKAFRLIQRFSEDIDVTVFRDDLGIPASVDELAALSGKKRNAALDAIKDACKAYINGPLADCLATICAETCARAGLGQDALAVKADAHDGQTLLLGYPSVTPTDAYIAKSVKIESGAKSALDPHSVRTITPYVDADVPGIDLAVPGITVVDAERTFWDKVVILHGLRRWYDIAGCSAATASAFRGTITISSACSSPTAGKWQRRILRSGQTASPMPACFSIDPILIWHRHNHQQDVRRVSHATTANEMVAIGREVEASVLSRAVRWHAEHEIIGNANQTVVLV
jgi:hypothetical protein